MTFMSRQQCAPTISVSTNFSQTLAKAAASLFSLFRREPNNDFYANQHFDKIARAQRDVNNFWNGLH